MFQGTGFHRAVLWAFSPQGYSLQSCSLTLGEGVALEKLKLAESKHTCIRLVESAVPLEGWGGGGRRGWLWNLFTSRGPPGPSLHRIKSPEQWWAISHKAPCYQKARCWFSAVLGLPTCNPRHTAGAQWSLERGTQEGFRLSSSKCKWGIWSCSFPHSGGDAVLPWLLQPEDSRVQALLFKTRLLVPLTL